MHKEEKNLYAFGYGLALLVPLIVTLHSIDHGLSPWAVIGLFVFTLFLVTRMVLFKPILNVWILMVQCVVAAKFRQEFGIVAFTFLALSIIILLITLKNVNLLKPVYVQWMKVAHLIGTIITGLFLSFMFYIIFGITGIVLRLLRKDILNEKLEPQANSYWIKRTKDHTSEKYYENQF